MRRSSVLIPVACLSALALPCIPVTSDASLVPVANEQALIVWNPAAKTEYFTRQAEFGGDGKPFGFLVPTPTKPELTESPSYLFDGLRLAIAPRIKYRERTGIIFGWLDDPTPHVSSAAGTTGGPSGGIDVIGEEHVGGFDAVSLRADDPAALSAWLGTNGFKRSKALEEWLKGYVERKWVITAFKIEDGKHLKPVCMEFKTDKPFYPYKEPASKANPKGRLLRVYFLSDQRYEGTLAGKPWAVPTSFSDEVGPGAMYLLEKERKLVGPARQWRLTSFEDGSNPRNGIEDVYYRPASTQAVIRPLPVVHYRDRRTFIPVTLWILPLGILAYCGVKIYRDVKQPSENRAIR